jgi:hypothetical protein
LGLLGIRKLLTDPTAKSVDFVVAMGMMSTNVITHKIFVLFNGHSKKRTSAFKNASLGSRCLGAL